MWGAAGVSEEDRLDREQAKWVMRRAASMLTPYRRWLVAAMVTSAVWTLTVLAGPWLVKWGIDSGIKPGDRDVLNRAVVLYVVVAALAYVAFRIQVLLVSRVGESFLRDLRLRVFDHLQRLSMPYYDREKSGVIVSRMTSDIDSLAELVQMGLLMVVMNAMLLGFSFLVLALASFRLLLVALIALPFVIAASVKFQRDSNKAYLTVRDRIGLTLSSLQEGVSGVRVIQAFNRQSVESDRFSERNRSLYDAHMDSVRVQAWYLPVIELAGLGTTAIVLGLGGWMVTRDLETIGTVTFFVLTLSNLFEPVQQLSQLFNQVQSAGAGLKKLYEVLDTPVDVDERAHVVRLPDRGAIAVEGLGFAYGDVASLDEPDVAPVLRDVDLQIAPGERLALVGPTGAGKSTLAKLVARLYDPVEGRITFGGVDLRDASLIELRRRIVVVPQEGFLFNGTVADNLRIARFDATDDEVEQALRDIGVWDRFAAMPDGLATEVRERGSRFSAGEKQLVSLARAALADPALLVLDEATSSLDPGTELLVENAMERLMEGRTVVVIAHRLSTAERADRVGVVDAGGLVEIGTHDDLLAAGGRYAALFATWAGRMASHASPTSPGAAAGPRSETPLQETS